MEQENVQVQEPVQEQAQVQEPKKKKKNIGFDIFLVLLILGVVGGVFLYSRGLVKTQATINGTEISANMTVQEVLDAGFAIDTSMSGSGDTDLKGYADIPGESYTSTFYYLFAKDAYGYYEYANIIIQLYNPDVNSADFKDCKIYSIQTDPSYSFSSAEVLLLGVDFTGMSKEEAVTAMEDLGIKFDADDKEEFLSGEKNIVIGKSGETSFYIETDYDGKTVTNVEARLNV